MVEANDRLELSNARQDVMQSRATFKIMFGVHVCQSNAMLYAYTQLSRLIAKLRLLCAERMYCERDRIYSLANEMDIRRNRHILNSGLPLYCVYRVHNQCIVHINLAKKSIDRDEDRQREREMVRISRLSRVDPTTYTQIALIRQSNKWKMEE